MSVEQPMSRSETLFDDNLPALREELERAQHKIRDLRRQINAAQSRYAEIARSYNLTVANLMEVTRQNTLLERECEVLRSRAESSPPLAVGPGGIELTLDEIGAIRKAMARLHHPDTGGDAERMKSWNMVLDSLER